MPGLHGAREGYCVGTCVEINQCVGCYGDDAAVMTPLSGEEPASPRHRAGVASMAWRTTRRICTDAPKNFDSHTGWYLAATSCARTASRARTTRGSWRSAPCAGRRSSRRCVFIFRLVMKEVRRKKEERGKGRVQSSRVLGRTVVPRVFGLARLVRPLVDIIVVAASVLAPRGI